MNCRISIALYFVPVALLCAATWGQSIQWQSDLKQAELQAASEQKLIFLHFSADWCRPCQHLEKFVFTSPRLIATINERVVPVNIDADQHPELLKEYGVSEIPTDVVMTPSGTVIVNRKSPKTSDDYIRMFKSLPDDPQEVSKDDAAVIAKLEQLTTASATKNAKKNNDFVPAGVGVSAANDAAIGQTFSPTIRNSADSANTENAFQVAPNQPLLAKNNTFGKPDKKISRRADLSQGSSNKSDRIVNNPFFGNQTVKENGNAVQSDPNDFRAAGLKNDVAALKPLNKFALGGKCPVTLIQTGKWSLGDKKFGCVHRGRTYLFASQAKLDLFRQSPDSYSPMLAGYDPVIFHERGELVDGLTVNGVFMGTAPKQRVLLFETTESRDRFQKDPSKYLQSVRLAVEQADQQSALR